MAKRNNGVLNSQQLNAISMLDIKTVANRLGVTTKTIRRWIKTGHFPMGTKLSNRVVRWHPSTVATFIKERNK